MKKTSEPPPVPVMKDFPSQTSPSKAQSEAGHKKQSRKLLGLILITLLLLFAIVAWVLRGLNLHDILFFWGSITGNTVDYELVDVRNNTVLLVTCQGNQSAVKVRLAGQPNWIEISTGDGTVSNPALSPSGKLVAYLSEQDERHIVVAPVITGTRQIVDASLVQKGCVLVRNAEWDICPWSPIHWAPNERYLGFFACVKDAKISYVAIADLKSAPISVTCLDKEHSKSSIPGERTLIWQDDEQLIVTTFGDNETDIRIEFLDFP